MQAWSRTSHKNVQSLLGYYWSDETVVHFVSPLMENGTARDFIKKYPTTNRIVLVRHIIRPLSFLTPTSA